MLSYMSWTGGSRVTLSAPVIGLLHISSSARSVSCWDAGHLPPIHTVIMVDANHDRLVTLEEFLKSTERKEFNEAGGWETVEESQIYTEEELRRFEQELTVQEAALNQRAEELRKEHEALQQRQIELDAQKKEYQQAVIQMEQKKSQQAEAPAAGQNGELKFQAQVPEGAVETESHQGSDVHPGPPGEHHPAPPGEAAQQEKKDSAPSQEHQAHQV